MGHSRNRSMQGQVGTARKCTLAIVKNYYCRQLLNTAAKQKRISQIILPGMLPVLERRVLCNL